MNKFIILLLGLLSTIIFIIGFTIIDNRLLFTNNEKILGSILLICGAILFGIFMLSIRKSPFNVKRRTLLFLLISIGFLFGIVTNSIIPLFKTNFVLKENLWRYLYFLIFGSMLYYAIRELRRSILKNREE